MKTIGTFLALLGLYLLGIAHWVWFYNGGNFALEGVDWPKEHDYYTILQEALIQGQMPYHMSSVHHGTDRFLGLPEIILAPHILLLPFLTISSFLMVHTLVLYSVGFVGCLLLRRRYQLGLLPFIVLDLLFNFNGYITAHLAVGHSMWTGYYLLPFYALFLLEMLEEPEPIRPALKLALALFAMMLQGAFHFLVWSWMFLILLAVCNRTYVKPVLVTIGFSGWLSFFRLLPAALIFREADKRIFQTGYPTLNDVLDAFITLRDRNYPALGCPITRQFLFWWEFDIYVGVLGLALLLYFGVYLRRSKDPALERYRYPALDLPLLIFGFLSLNYFYACIANLPIPLFNTEAISSRFLIVPVVLLLVIAVVRMQRVLGHTKINAFLYVFLIGGILQTAFTLWTHSYLWRIPPLPAGAAQVEPSGTIVNRPDPLYVSSLYGSAAVSLLAVPAWWYTFRQARRVLGKPRSTLPQD